MSATSKIPPVPQENLQTLLTTAKKLHNGGLIPYARMSFESCLKTATDPVMRLEIHHYLGHCCHEMGDNSQATRHFESAVEINDQSEKGQIITAFCLNRLNKNEEGLQIAHQVLKNNPNCYKATYVLKKIYEEMGETEQANRLKEKLKD